MRTCDGCTECCTGTVSGEVNNIHFYKGRACHYLSPGGCTIYEDRPEDPCKSFNCQWILDDELPFWFRPDISGLLISKRRKGDCEFYAALETDKPMQAHVLNWLLLWTLRKGHNLVYSIQGGENRIGSTIFNNLNLEGSVNVRKSDTTEF